VTAGNGQWPEARLRVAVVGATGAVGTIMLRLLERRGFPAGEIVPFASERSAGRRLGDLVVAPLREDTIGGFDVALFSAGGATSREWAPRFAAAGAVVVDNSSAWRMDPDVPLVVSEVNPDALDGLAKGIVANPNCTTMAVMLPAKALHDAFGLRAMTCTSFQAAGGAGQKGMDELAAQVDPVRGHDLVNDGAAAAASVEAPVHVKALAFNVVPWLGKEAGGGYSDEEMKLQNESRKILSLPDLAVAPTCVRVPVMVGHAVEVRATFDRPVSVEAAREAMAAFPNLELDDVPTPLEWAGRDEVAVGRIRADLSDDHSLNFFVVGDNLLKGAALNTVQIAELLHARGLVGGLAPSTARASE
jgi:aspartate-semialdehyde dehydrogenase